MKLVKPFWILKLLGIDIVIREYWKEKIIAKHTLLKVKKYEFTLLWFKCEIKKWIK